MQDMTDNLDELTRRAAENYPLKIKNSDWEHIAYRLTTPASPAPVNRKRVIKKYIGSFLLILFLLFAGSFLKTFNTDVKPGFVEEKAVDHYSQAESNGIASISTQLPHSASMNNEKKRKRYIATKANPVYPGEANILIVKGDRLKNIEVTDMIRVQTDTGTSRQIRPGGMKSLIDMINKEKEINKRGARQVRQSHSVGFYYGVGLGPQFNEVKSQKMRKPGFDAGIVLGYRFTPKVSVETGVLFSKKYYFSKGEHFKMDVPGMKLLSMEGNSSVFEIPARIKYDAWSFRHTKLFLAAGLSSYIIMSEKNNYRVLMNGIEQNMNASYTHTAGYFAAALNTSAGFENQIGKFTSIRIEPFLQVPLKGIGVGAMPVMSAGIHFFITRQQ